MTEKQTSAELVIIAHRIEDRYRALVSLESKVQQWASSAVAEAILIGQDLIAAKSKVGSGTWGDWLKAHCPSISHATVSRFMALARNVGTAKMDEAKSMRQALALIEYGSTKECKPKGNRTPPYLYGLQRLARFVNFFSQLPVGKWPPQGRDELKEKLAPIVAELWPGAELK
jgi:hypothetical protein